MIENNLELDSYERELLESIEGTQWQETPNIENERKRMKAYALNTQEKVKEIHIKLNENVFYQFKKRAIENGLSYQMLINALIHNYNTGKINLTL